MTRQVVLDTETTGLSPKQGHRIIEIGCVEMIDRRITGSHYQVYINPQRDIDEGAVKVHGITRTFLSDKPDFVEVVEAFVDYIKDSELIIHNAPFDVEFIDSELKRLGKHWGKTAHYARITDTLQMARRKHPGQKNNLDALCKRYQISNEHRQYHGALLDAEILAHVYLAMTRGQESLWAHTERADARARHTPAQTPGAHSAGSGATPSEAGVVVKASVDECEAHREMLRDMASAGTAVVWDE